MKFNYQARTKTGEIQTGTIEASSKEGALNLLQKYGLYVTLLEEVERKPFYTKKIKIFERISKKEIVLFSRQLAVMLKSKIPPVETLHTLAKQTKKENFKEKILNIAGEVEGGTSLSGAFSLHPKEFSPFYISMIKSGEASGKLSEAVDHLADHLEREYNLNEKIKGAMIYPAFILVALLAIIAAMIIFVIPQLSEILKETGAELPLITKIVLGSSEFLRSWGWILILALILLIIFILRFSKTKEGKKIFDKIFLKLPLIGVFFKEVYLSRFAENLSTLISGGLPITQALEITGEIVGNDVYQSIILRTRDEVKRGEAISTVLERYPDVIPPLFIQMTVVGERSGRLGLALMNVVDFYQKEVDRALENFINLLEPVLIVFLGLIVAGFVAAVLMPIYRMGIM